MPKAKCGHLAPQLPTNNIYFGFQLKRSQVAPACLFVVALLCCIQTGHVPLMFYPSTRALNSKI